MVSNGVYQRKDEGGVTSGTHVSSHSKISNYNSGERDYEEIMDMGNDKHDYHHLQRPSPPMPHPSSSRNATFNFTPPTEFHSMSTLTSQLGQVPSSRGPGVGEREAMHQFQARKGSTIGIGPEDHVYRELEQTSPSNLTPVVQTTGAGKDIYRSPTVSDSPDSAQLFGGKGTMPSMQTDTGIFGYPANESLYTPTFDPSQSARVQQGGLENVPETGTMFSEPVNPTAFPVHNYEEIPKPQYETPIITRKKAMSTSSSVPPPVASQSATGGRPRTNSGTRYETEMPQALSEDRSQYSKLVRPEPLAFNTASPFYSELGSSLPDEVVVKPQIDKGIFSRSTAELSKRDMVSLGGNLDRGFTVPSNLGAMGVVVNRASSSSTTDSLSSYIAHLQANESNKMVTDFQMDGLLFYSVESSTPPDVEEIQFQHGSCKRNASLNAGPRKTASLQGNEQKRAWSEERGDTGISMNRSGHGFSGSAIESNNICGVHMSTGAAKLHRDLRVNGFDPRLGEYARSKTMV